MSGDILELIDNAIDGALSDDAMRWTPDPPPRPRPVTLAEYEQALWNAVQPMAAALARSFDEVWAMMRRVASAYVKACNEAFAALTAFDNQRQRALAARRARLREMHTAYHRRHR